MRRVVSLVASSIGASILKQHLFLAIAFLFHLTCFSEDRSSATTENPPAALVAGSVNAITGDHYIVQNDIVIEGAVPLRIPRTYISGSQSTLFSGWQLFHHIYATAGNHEIDERILGFLTIIEPNGTHLEFKKSSRDKKEKTILYKLSDPLRNRGLTNAGRGELSGKTNLKNYQIRMTEDREVFHVYCPDGAQRVYHALSGSKRHKSSSKDLWPHQLFGSDSRLYLLQSETLPNKTGVAYEYDKHYRLKKISTTNYDGSKTYAWAKFHYLSEDFNENRDFEIRTSDGKTLHYHYKREHRSFFLNYVITPASPNETIFYKPVKDRESRREEDLLTSRSVGLGRHYKLDHYPNGKVKILSAPVGEDGTAHITHRFFYFPEKNLTQVREIDNTLTEYYYSDNLLLEKIKRFAPAGDLRNTEQFVWGTSESAKSQLFCHTLLDHQDIPVSSHRYFYDDLGNVKEERSYAKITGEECPPLTLDSTGLPLDNGTETQSIHREFSQDGLNLLLREEDPSGKVTTFEYLTGTSLLTAKFISDGQGTKIRTFYQYNADFILIEEVVDDGCATKKIRRITPVPDDESHRGMPWIVQDSYLDGSNEVLLKKVILSYENGKVVKQDIYDAHDRYRYSLTMKYDNAGRLIESTNALGQITSYAYDPLGNLIQSQDSSGKLVTKMDYDYSNRLTRIEEIGADGKQRTLKHAYDKKGHKIATTDPYGHTTKFVIDPFGNEIERHHPSIFDSEGHSLSRETLHSYDSLGRLLSTTEPNGESTSYSYNAKNQPLSVQHPDGTSEQFVYNRDGKLRRHVNQIGAVTTYVYDFLGRPTAKTNALGNTTAYQYDAFNTTSITDAEGNVTTYEYDGAGRKTAESLGAQRTEFSYDALGRLFCTSFGDLSTIQEYDDLNRVIEERQEDLSGKLLSKISYSYDAAGNRESVTRYIHNQEAQETFIYDSFNRLIAYTDPLGQKTTTDYNDYFENSQGQRVLRTTETDPLGLKTLTTYDTQGHVSSVEKKNAQGELLTLEENFYNIAGDQTHRLKDNRPVATWIYGAMHRPSALIEGTSRTTQFTYLPTGELAQRIKPSGVAIENSYDITGQLTQVRSSDGTIQYSFLYNKIGQQIEAKDELTQKTTLRSYDPQGRLSQETLANGLTLTSNYDDQGRISDLLLPNNSTIAYTYDALHLRTIEYQGLTHVFDSYDLAGNLLEEKRIGGLGTAYSYDLLGRRQSSYSSRYAQQSAFDSIGNVTTLRTNGNLETFTYDDQSQLTSEKGHSYAYDASGNRLSKDGDVQNYDLVNQIVSPSLAYDPSGNLAQNAPYTFIYDAFDRMVEADTPTGRIRFIYDAYGRIVSKEANGKEFLYLYDGDKEIGMADRSGKIVQLRVLNPTFPSERGAAILLQINNQIYCPVHDLFGNVRQLVDLKQNLVESYDYSAFGEGVVSGVNPWKFASKRCHEEVSLIFFGKRFYDPEKGRWLTPDPAGFSDGDNLYQFVGNNPLAKMDLFGLRAESIQRMSYDGQINTVQFDPIRDLEHQPRISVVQFDPILRPEYQFSWEMDYPTFAPERDEIVYGASGGFSLGDVVRSPRFHGALQCVAGFAEASVGAGLMWTPLAPLGAFLFVHGSDHSAAGCHAVIFGNQRATATAHLLQHMGVSRETAAFLDHGTNLMATLGGAALASKATRGAIFMSAPGLGKTGMTALYERPLLQFTDTAGKHMYEVERRIPIHILDRMIKSPMAAVKDPQGATDALMYYSQIWKNGRLYNAEVLYDKATKTVSHFQYTQKPLGPLQKVTKQNVR